MRGAHLHMLRVIVLATLMACPALGQAGESGKAAQRGPDAAAPEAEAVVRSLYRMVSFQAGKDVDWERVKSLFIPEAVIVLRSSRTAMSVFDPDGFVRDFVKFIADAKLSDRAFEETVLAASTAQSGDVARVSVHYAARIPASGRPADEGIDIFLLMRKDGAWKIVSVVNEVIRPGVTLPPELRR